MPESSAHCLPRLDPPKPLQYMLATDAFQLGYDVNGHCKGEMDPDIPPPQKLQWEIPEEVRAGGRA